MFTGIVQDVGRIQERGKRGGDARMVVAFERLDPAGIRVGDSICVQGVCLTVTELLGRAFAADVSRETLSLTTLGDLAVGSPVNLETSLRAGDPLGGHLVSGHVDGVAQVVAVSGDARSLRLKIAVPSELARYIARKGSIAVDGVSLTINEVEDAVFERFEKRGVLVAFGPCLVELLPLLKILELGPDGGRNSSALRSLVAVSPFCVPLWAAHSR